MLTVQVFRNWEWFCTASNIDKGGGEGAHNMQGVRWIKNTQEDKVSPPSLQPVEVQIVARFPDNTAILNKIIIFYFPVLY